MSSFYGLNIAKTGLFLSQKALNVTGHNIANANMEGYTRQRIISESIEPSSANAFWAPFGKGRVGGGTQVQVLDQIRDAFVDKELRRGYCDSAMLANKADTFIYIENMFDETSTSSISVAIEDFFRAVEEMHTDPTKKDLRTNMRQSIIKMTETFNHYHKTLSELQKVQNDSMKIAVDNINDHINNIAEFNRQIFMYELSGEQANDLRDKRNLLIDDLSKLVNIEYAYDDEDKLTIAVEGQTLVSHLKVQQLKVIDDGQGVVTNQPGFYRICMDDGLETEFQYSSGELAGYRSMRDGNAPDNIGIPRMIDNLNILARAFAQEFNAINNAGYTYPHDGIDSDLGPNLFYVPTDGGGSEDYSLLHAGNFVISQQVYDDPFMIACSSVKIDITGDEHAEYGNNLNAIAMQQLLASENVPSVKNFEQFLKSLLIEISVESGHVQDLAGSQQAVVSNLENKKESISGVSIDEEVVNMLQFQHMYAASSRMITAIDEALDVLINRMGLVGRA